MIYVWYFDVFGRRIESKLQDWDAVLVRAQTLTKAPIDLDYIYYRDGDKRGVFNLNTFEKC